MKMARSKDGEGIQSTLIIAEVQKRPVLYDANHQNYGERALKMQQWEEVCAAVLPEWATMSVSERHASVKDIQKRWRSIRDSYTKAYRQGKCTPPGAVPPGGGRRSQHQRQMAFLYNALQRKVPRPSTDKPTPDTEPPSPQADAPDLKLENGIDETPHKPESRLPSVDTAEDEEPQPSFEAKLNADMKIIEDTQEPTSNEVRKSVEIKIDANTILPEDHFDDDRLFMNSLLPFFKKMDDDTRLACRIEVLKIIKYALRAQKSYDRSRLEEVLVKEEAKSPESRDEIKSDGSTTSALRMCRKRKATPEPSEQPAPVRKRPGRPRKKYIVWPEITEEERALWRQWEEEELQRSRERADRCRKRDEVRKRELLTQEEEEIYQATSVTQLKPPQFLKMYNLEPAKKSAKRQARKPVSSTTLATPDATHIQETYKKELLHGPL